MTTSTAGFAVVARIDPFVTDEDVPAGSDLTSLPIPTSDGGNTVPAVRLSLSEADAFTVVSGQDGAVVVTDARTGTEWTVTVQPETAATRYVAVPKPAPVAEPEEPVYTITDAAPAPEPAPEPAPATPEQAAPQLDDHPAPTAPEVAADVPVTDAPATAPQAQTITAMLMSDLAATPDGTEFRTEAPDDAGNPGATHVTLAADADSVATFQAEPGESLTVHGVIDTRTGARWDVTRIVMPAHEGIPQQAGWFAAPQNATQEAQGADVAADEPTPGTEAPLMVSARSGAAHVETARNLLERADHETSERRKDRAVAKAAVHARLAALAFDVEFETALHADRAADSDALTVARDAALAPWGRVFGIGEAL